MPQYAPRPPGVPRLAPRSLRFVKAAVGELEEALRPGQVLGQACGAGTERKVVGKGGAKASEEALHRLGVRVEQEHAELVAAEPSGRVRLPGRGRQRRREDAQEAVAL